MCFSCQKRIIAVGKKKKKKGREGNEKEEKK